MPAPPNLLWVMVGFTAPIDGLDPGAVTVRAPGGAAIVASACAVGSGEPPCNRDDACACLELKGELLPGSVHEVVVGPGMRWQAGGPVPAAVLPFHVAADRDEAPPTATASATVSDGCMVARATVSEPAWAELVLSPAGGWPRRMVASALSDSHEVALDLAAQTPGAELAVSIELHDMAGNLAASSLGVVVAPGRAEWAISEVLANPAGPEPAQEWVEVVRLSDRSGSLAGLWLGDGRGRDALPDVVVPAGGRALVVPRDYAEAAPGDVAPAPGTLIARLAGTTIGHSGLANSGETTWLFDAAGTPLSVMTPYFDVSSGGWAGRSVERIAPGACDVRANVAPNAARAATPGARNSVEE